MIMSKAVAKKTEETGSVVEVAAPVSEGSSLIALIERAARDQSVDIDKMERLFQMHERVTARAAEAAFNAAMARAQAELKPVARNLRNTQTNSNYADLAAISDAADPIIHKHGFGVITSEFQSAVPNHLGVRCKITHADGHSESYDFNIPIDGTGLKGNPNKTATHAYGSTITYGRRYAKCSVFDIATKDDKDGNRPKDDDTPVSDEQAEAIAKKITEVGADINAFLKLGNVESISDIPAKDYNRVMQLLEAKKHKAANGK
jgi:hypothetical protein